MSEDRNLDEMLRRYLQREEADPIRKRLENLSEWTIEHEEKDNTRHAELLLSQQSHNFRLQTLEQRAERVEDAVEDTKEHDLEELRKKQHRINDTVFKVVVGVLLVLLGAGVYASIRDVAAGRQIQTPTHVEGK